MVYLNQVRSSGVSVVYVLWLKKYLHRSQNPRCGKQSGWQYTHCSHWQPINAEVADQTPIELYDFSDFLSEIFYAFENAANIEDQENVESREFTFLYTVNIVTLEGNSKEKADHIIKVISDVDEYVWM